MQKQVYFFGGGQAEGTGTQKNLLGGKGANLAEMTNLGIPVPAGFTITTEVCIAYYENNSQWPPGLEAEIQENLREVEAAMGTGFGDPKNPLLLSVRSGARVSMPGMMDTVLNMGLNAETVEGLAQQSGSTRFAYDSYRRLIQMYGDVVMGVPHHAFEDLIVARKQERGVEQDTELTAEDMQHLVEAFKQLVQEQAGRPFPDDPYEQLRGAVNAVFDSWNIPRAVRYRQLHDIPHNWGTAVNVQAMVFGNLGETSGTGVAFTRNPSTGENVFYGEYLINAQGEDVVAGTRTPQPISTLQDAMPEVYKQLEDIYLRLEHHYKDMQDIEFTIQDGTLYMLQTRSGKRTAAASVRIAVEMVDEGLIDEKAAVLQIDPDQLDQLLHPTIDPAAQLEPLTKGLPASPGAAVGRVVFDADDAEAWVERGEQVILVRAETSPEDIGGMAVAEGILTSRGGMTSHAAVVARGMGKPCVAGAGAVKVDVKGRQFTVDGQAVQEGDWLTLDGTRGEVVLGQVDLVDPEMSGNFARIMEWADRFRDLQVWTNADTPHDAQVAKEFGAEGIGLCRTEHMFFGDERILAVRKMILAEDEDSRNQAIAKLLPMQRDDFLEIFRVMAGLPVTIRLLDPPLHEFLPHESDVVSSVAGEMGVPVEQVQSKVKSLQEFNPMLGHRGCRLGITFPEIYEMQAQAIFEAACQLTAEGVQVIPEVMIPLVGMAREFEILKERVDRVARDVMEKAGVQVEYTVGTMIEVPRAALTANRIADQAAFFSFGTNDLTQMGLGFSRDDAGTFLPAYLDQGILERDPFQSLDQEGIGELVKLGFERGRATNPKLKVGICGEHGGDPASVGFCHQVGLDYVSCSPYRVPIARVAAAQANLKQPR